MIESVKFEELEKMEHAIGFENRRVKRNRYIAYRNFYAAPKCADGDWQHLVAIGYAKQGEITQNCIMYHVTREGMNFIERVTGVKILEED